MMRSTPTSCRSADSTGRRKLAPIQQFRWKYSLGVSDSCSTAAPPKWYSAAVVMRMRFVNQSRLASVPGTQLVPCSVSTNFSRGWRSNTPAKISAHSARCA